MNLSHVVLVAGLGIGFLNLRSPDPHPGSGQRSSVSWPAEFEGQPLRHLPLSTMERSFAAAFPGAIAHFQCGDRQVILRQANRATRKLHRSATCLRAAGFQTGPEAVERHGGTPWSAYRATRGGRTIRVREQIRASRDPGATWTDVSLWFWHASLHPDEGPWLAVTVLEEDP